MGVRLTPGGHLRWEPEPDAQEAAVAADLAPVVDAFRSDWRGALFTLAAEKLPAQEIPSLRYWQQLAEHYLTGLCHLPADAAQVAVEPPGDGLLATWVLNAPPMEGGEYLSPDCLRGLWGRFDEWVREAAAAAGGPVALLRERAPRWRQVGRVCFHLAENRNDQERPFAFLATYASGFGAGGRLKHLPLRNALQQYAGANNRAALINLLAPVEEAAKACEWVRALADSGDLYRPLAWPPAHAYRFLQSVPELEQSGLSVRVPNWWRKRARPQVSVTIGTQTPARVGADAVLDFKVEVALGDRALSAEELEALRSASDNLVLLRNQWVEVDRDRLDQAITHWETLQRQADGEQISFVEGMRLLAGASTDLRQEDQTEADRPWVQVTAGAALRELLAGLRRPDTLGQPDLAATEALRGTLRPYQRAGLAWLHFVTGLGLGACLADDMGLGKTIQVLALLLCGRGAGEHPPAPALLVVPASLLGNWSAEAARFAPSLKLCFLHPAETDREKLEQIASAPAEHLAATDLAITTYTMLVRQTWLAELHWRLVILDEAQAIRNPATRQSRAARKLAADARIALTGTPVENRLGDLWALFDFLNPGLLGSRTVFATFVKKLQTRPRQPFAPLRRLVSPYILRRLKTDRSIIADLPEKTETNRYCHLTRAQVRLYQLVVQTLQRALESSQGIKRRGLVLGSLLRLKQVCNHPSQLSGDGEYAAAASGKFLRLAELCEELAARQERVLIFTQYREIIDPLAEYAATLFGSAGLVLHGGTGVGERRAVVDRFQADDGPPFLILSLKAGGTGLNLTGASHVIHFDRWWNPAVENQATDRAFRIGQRRNVLVHKFITRGTVEERIDAMIADKRKLAQDVLEGEQEISLTELSDDDLLDLVRLDVTSATL